MPNAELVKHNATQFRKEVIQIARGVWTAVGFAGSNQHMIEGVTSVTIIDTSESTGAAVQISTAFKSICDKPVGRIIYTHSHRDHISGATVFADGSDVPIIASRAFSSDLVGQDENVIAPHKALNQRTAAQFGIGLTSGERISLGCGPGERPMEGMGAGFIPPNQFVDHDRDIDLDGVKARLVIAPGETADHIAVWLPDVRVLFPGDNWYHAFPNLYAIRGTPYRDFAAWAETLSMLSEFDADVLSPGHSRPVFGKDKVHEVLTSTRDAIVHIMRSTADGMNAGKPLDDIVASSSLPQHLAEKPWLKEYYGKASWSARAFAVGTLGWYDGNPTNLGSISSEDRAQHLADLAGGVPQLMDAAKSTTDLQWKLELFDALKTLGEPVATLKASTLEELAENEVNATARNTYFWHAHRLRETEA